MNVVRIDHINIRVPNPLLDEVRRFYVDVLGLTEGERPSFSSRGYWLYAAGIPLVHLSERKQRGNSSGNGYLDHVAFHVTDPDTLIKRLEKAGIGYSQSHIAELGLGQLFFQDPAGNGLEANFRTQD